MKTGEIDIQGGNKTVKTSAGFLQVGTSGSHYLSLITAGDQRVNITSTGNVGINEINPTAKLHVAGYVLFGPDGTSNQYQGLSLRHGRDSSANIATGYIDFRNDLNTVDANMFVDHQTDGGSTIIFSNTPVGDRSTDRRVERLRVTSAGRVLIGTTAPRSFNAVGQEHGLIVAGSTSSTNILGNSYAALTISNKDGTANNTAGLHFAREDTDNDPHYCGASIVAQFKETQVTGQYPKTDLAFLTSLAANHAPRENMRIHASGNITTPHQAAFFANGAGGWTDLIDGGKIMLTDSTNNSKLNNTNRNSSYYDSTNARFTAPVEGLYHISVVLYVNNNNSANVCSIVPRVNGAQLQPNDILFFFSLTYGTTDFAQSGSINLYLNAGDYVELYKRAGNTGTNKYYKGHSHWSGHLLG